MVSMTSFRFYWIQYDISLLNQFAVKYMIKQDMLQSKLLFKDQDGNDRVLKTEAKFTSVCA